MHLYFHLRYQNNAFLYIYHPHYYLYLSILRSADADPKFDIRTPSVTARQIEKNLERAFKNLEKPRFLLLTLGPFMAPRTYIPDE